MTDQTHDLAALVDSASRRQLTQLILEQVGVAAGIALCGTILLLLVGTQILDWFWLAGLFIVSFGVGVWRTVRGIPTRYRLAQTIDSRLDLQDTLSTALFFEAGSQGGATQDLIEYQRGQAERLASGLDAGAVFPLRVPKAAYAVAGVALVACGMFAVRYGVTRSLDLRPSLVKIALDTFWKQDESPKAARKIPLERRIEEQLKKLGIQLGSSGDEAKERDAMPETAMNTVDAPQANNAESGDNAQAKPNSAAKGEEPGEEDGGGKSERASGSEDPNGNDEGADKAQGAAQDGKQDPAPKNADQQGENEKSSMLDRMRDAMANLLNKLKMQPKDSEKQQMAKDAKGGGKGPEAQSQKGTPGKPQSSGASSRDQQGEQQGQGEKSQSAQGQQSGDKNGDRQPSQDAKSGIGRDDGDKSAREAEQLAAMGKISEILGKRAQNLSGELMVEVAGGNQQLKTAYSGTTGKHAVAGGEITRDEVPAMYRNFVQQYFEQIRKAPSPTAGAKTKSAGIAPARKSGKVTE